MKGVADRRDGGEAVDEPEVRGKFANGRQPDGNAGAACRIEVAR